MACPLLGCRTWRSVSDHHMPRVHATLRDVVALPPEGSQAQQQETSGKLVFLAPTLQLTFGLIVDSDDDIVMPEGPPPGVEEEPIDSGDDIPMPEGPPPGNERGTYTPNDWHCRLMYPQLRCYYNHRRSPLRYHPIRCLRCYHHRLQDLVPNHHTPHLYPLLQDSQASPHHPQAS